MSLEIKGLPLETEEAYIPRCLAASASLMCQ